MGGRDYRFDQFLNGDIRRCAPVSKPRPVASTLAPVGRELSRRPVAGDLWSKNVEYERFLLLKGQVPVACRQGLGKTTDIKLDLTLTPDGVWPARCGGLIWAQSVGQVRQYYGLNGTRM